MVRSTETLSLRKGECVKSQQHLFFLHSQLPSEWGIQTQHRQLNELKTLESEHQLLQPI